MEEKSIEVLEAEYTALKKENLARQIAAEKAQAEEAQQLADAAKADEYKEQIRKEYKEELAQESHITKGAEPEKMVANDSKFQVFLSKFRESKNLKGTTYEETIKDLCNKGGY